MKNMKTIHLDEAKLILKNQITTNWGELHAEKILIIEDSFGRFSIAAWGPDVNIQMLKNQLNEIRPFDADVFLAPKFDEFDPLSLESSWAEALPNSDEYYDKFRWITRHRMLPAWQYIREQPLWPSSEGSKIVTFYSFKGGMGRSTALAAFALDRLKKDEHIVVVDLDLDAPGLGTILPGESHSPYGVVDYLIEMPILGERPPDLLDYSWRAQIDELHSSGSLRVFPAGRLDENYLGKLARLDFEKTEDINHPLDELLLQINETFKPDWILLDSRTGFSETAGMLLSGMAHYHVLVGVNSEQSWNGLTYALKKLGSERIFRGIPQAEVMMIQGLIPNINREAKDAIKQQFLEKSEDIFSEIYYIADTQETMRDENFWYLNDIGIPEAPHRAQHISYLNELAQSTSINDILDAIEQDKSGYPSFCLELHRKTQS